METAIKASLIKLMDGIKRADGTVILDCSSELDEIARRARGQLHPQLVHFLERRSYDKALQFLSGVADIPAGICGGGKVRTPANELPKQDTD
ncbi:MAG: hypothetical protein QM790_10145 [Nibricoccus sp.]